MDISTVVINTLLGMGTVFLVLILMMMVIYCFRLIPYVQSKLTKTCEQAEVLVESVQEEDEVVDLSLIAIITAAIATYEGSNSTDGIVIRSIKKSRRRR